MADSPSARKPLYILLFVALAGCITFFRLLPVQDYSAGAEMETLSVLGIPLAQWPAPDLLLCMTLAWIIRRPDLLPAPVIAGYFLLEDLLLLRPPGLWALIVLITTEFLRARNSALRNFGFGVEYALITGLMLAMFLAYRAILAIVMVPQAPLDLSAAQFLGSVALYPLVVVGLHLVLKLRKPATGEVDVLGQKL